ncbi:MAG: hypothetical protein EA392_00385 [Cryomorphaceae bacterium]|nr:MAG: hypothetical protein EA392_00385 [Cryomorphaceae bacterium]
MTYICGELQDYTYNCAFPEAGGADEELLLIQHNDIDRTAGQNGFTFNTTNPTIIEAIGIKVGKQAFAFKGKRNPNAVMSEPVEQDFSSGFQHGLMFNLYEVSPATVEILKSLQQNKVMGILKTNQRNSTGNNIFKVVGRAVGLYLVEGTYNSAENQGVVQVTLQPQGDLLEPNFMEFLFDTDIPTTVALYESLKEEVPPAE